MHGLVTAELASEPGVHDCVSFLLPLPPLPTPRPKFLRLGPVRWEGS